jgi:hypothetical protein
MSNKPYDGRDTDVDNGLARRADDDGATAGGPIRLDLPNIERDEAGIPTFVFKDRLPDGDKPTAERKTLEVVLLWREAVMSVGHYRQPRAITVGDHMKNDFRISAEGLQDDRFSLVEPDGDEFVVHWADTMTAEVRGEDGEILDEAALRSRQRIAESRRGDHQRSQYKVGLHDRVAVQLGEITFVIQYVSPARIVQTSILKTLDFYFAKVLSLSALGHAFLILALLLTPLDPEGLSEDLFKNPNRFAKLILKEPEAPPKKKKFELSGSKGGGKHKEKEGKFGKKDQKKDALASTKGAPKVDPNKREKDRKIALQSGIFAALNGGKGGAVSDVFGPGGLGTGINNALGGLRGTSMGDAGGAGGLGTRGTGPGGGGSSLGIGGLGNGSGRGTGGLGNVDLGGRGKGKYRVIPGRTVTKGCLSQRVVGRVISRAHNQAKYCYEKELNRNPNLSGKITSHFVIGPTGTVMTARVAQTTLNDKAVEDCLVRVIKRLRFPPCAGGGTVDVTYPWIFKTGGN